MEVPLRIDDRIDCKDSIQQWCKAVVIGKVVRQSDGGHAVVVHVHYVGYAEKWQEWIEVPKDPMEFASRFALRGTHTREGDGTPSDKDDEFLRVREELREHAAAREELRQHTRLRQTQIGATETPRYDTAQPPPYQEQEQQTTSDSLQDINLSAHGLEICAQEDIDISVLKTISGDELKELSFRFGDRKKIEAWQSKQRVYPTLNDLRLTSTETAAYQPQAPTAPPETQMEAHTPQVLSFRQGTPQVLSFRPGDFKKVEAYTASPAAPLQAIGLSPHALEICARERMDASVLQMLSADVMQRLSFRFGDRKKIEVWQAEQSEPMISAQMSAEGQNYQPRTHGCSDSKLDAQEPQSQPGEQGPSVRALTESQNYQSREQSDSELEAQVSPDSMSALDIFRLDGKVAWVTGGSKGLGYQFASALASVGATVVLNSRNDDEAKEAAANISKKYGVKTAGAEVDCANYDDVNQFVEEVVKAFGSLDILVNNAGINVRANTVDMSVEQFKEVIDINLTGTFMCTKAVAPEMMKRGWGRIVNLSSIMGLVGAEGHAAYTASKAAIIALTKTNALEFAETGITVNALCPGPFETPANRSRVNDPGRNEGLVSKIPMRRWGYLEELNGALLYFASHASSYTTGTTLAIDGGYTAQ